MKIPQARKPKINNPKMSKNTKINKDTSVELKYNNKSYNHRKMICDDFECDFDIKQKQRDKKYYN